MKRSVLRTAIVVALVLSLGTNVYLAVLLVNAGKLQDGAESQVDLLWERRNIALKIIRHDWIGRPSLELDALASDLEAEGVTVDLEGNAREVGDYVFELKDGTVTDVYDYSGAME